ncbi:MAG TPA: sulfocyanin-like copper-binding protein [Dongiaceae bacterium]|jgi:uncharacterized cupredoxin-like copper-binding protein|nr:sulfocyanin-like copper-binding protein [Dongiaceae bacterium]
MKRAFFAFAAAVAMPALPAAAQSGQTVNVIMLDMTALMGPGYVGGYGMMGPNGMMGGRYGYGRMVPGTMMGNAAPDDRNTASTVPVTGMMPGMMSIRTDRDTVKAGPVTFDVVNLSRSLVHDLVVIAVDPNNPSLPYDYNNWQVVESQTKVAGEMEQVKPDDEATLTLTLPAGDYVLICNVPGHFAAGMVAPLTVTK